MLKPQYDYILCEEIKPDSGVVTGAEVGDHWQKYKVLAVGPGRQSQEGKIVHVPVAIKKGAIIYTQAHSEADTPPELKKINQALIMASRVMAVEE